MLPLVLLAAWLVPVSGPVVRPFTGGPDPFAAGLHRGVVFRARPGEVVRASCPGAVTFSGRTPRGAAVTVRCGGLRVTYLGLRPGVRRGDRVAAGAPVGRAGGELSLSVRALGGYLDPARFLGPGDVPRRPPPVGPREHPARPERGRPATRIAAPRGEPVAAPSAARISEPRPPAPWPAWAGLALVLAGVARTRVLHRRRAARTAPARVTSLRPPA